MPSSDTRYKKGHPKTSNGRPKVLPELKSWREEIRSWTPEIFTRLRAIALASTNKPAAIQASRVILAYAHGQPSQTIEMRDVPLQADVQSVMDKLAKDSADLRGQREQMRQLPCTIEAEIIPIQKSS